MLRTGKTPEITVRSAISAPPPFRKLHCSGQKQPNSLEKQNQSDTPPLDYAPGWIRLPCRPTADQPCRCVPSAWSQKTWLALARLRRETSPADTANGCWLCGGVGMREQVFADGQYEGGQWWPSAKTFALPDGNTRDVICNAAHCSIPLAREPSANGFPPSPRATTRPTARFIEI